MLIEVVLSEALLLFFDGQGRFRESIESVGRGALQQSRLRNADDFVLIEERESENQSRHGVFVITDENVSGRERLDSPAQVERDLDAAELLDPCLDFAH